MTKLTGSFSSLFKKYRLRSEINRLTEFADLLAEEGMIYEMSLFTRWQNGERIPRDRKVLLAILRVFGKKGGLHAVEDANELMESVEQRNLTEDELTEFKTYFTFKEEVEPENIQLAEKIEQGEVSEVKPEVVESRQLFRLSGIQKVLLGFVLFIILWWIRLNYYHIRETGEVYLFEAVYGLIPLFGAINGLLLSRKFDQWKTSKGKSIIFFSLGLLALWFGQTVWSYYNIIAHIELPYPSIADLGFVSIIPFYTLGSYYLGKDAGVKLEIKSQKDFIILMIPIVILIPAYFLFLRHITFDFSSPIRLFLDFMYSFGEISTIIFTVIIFSLSQWDKAVRNKFILIIGALLMQCATDCAFIYRASHGYYYNGDVIDILMIVSFFVMSVVIENIGSTNNLPVKNIIHQNSIDNLKVVSIESVNQKEPTNINRTNIFLTAIFIMFTIYWILQDTKAPRFFGDFASTYFIMALLGGLVGIRIYHKLGGFQNLIARSILMFSCGLFAQVFGQLCYAYLMYYKKTEIAYPSLGDVGYFGSIPLYLYGVILLSKALGQKTEIRSFIRQVRALIVPLVLLSLSYLHFLKDYRFDWSQSIKIFLDFGYPLGQSLYISFGILLFLRSRGLNENIRDKVRLIFITLLIQYIADYTFLYQSSKGIYKTGEIVDFIYLISYFLMSLGICNFYKLNPVYNSNIINNKQCLATIVTYINKLILIFVKKKTMLNLNTLSKI